MAEKCVKLNDIIETLEHEWGYDGMREDLEKLHTTDVVEVKHGYWKKRTVYPMGYNCSECNNSETYKSPFCRLCGTKMDGTPQKEG